MHKITRFHASSYEGWGLIDGDAIHELDSPWSGKRGRSHPLSGVRLVAACAPSKIVGVGRNYREHAKELGNEVPAEPLIFLKPPSSLIASGDSIVYPATSQNVHYEGELGVVIGVRARHVTAAEAEICNAVHDARAGRPHRHRHSVRRWAHANRLHGFG